MKAITLWQPWASLVVAGVKPYEFRSWPAPRSLNGTRIGIHAGARPVRKAEIADLIIRLHTRRNSWTVALRPAAAELLERWHAAPGELPLSSMLCTAVLGQPKLGLAVAAEFGRRAGLGDRAPNPLNDSDRDVHSNWAWPLTDIVPLEPFIPARGAQGFWDWDERAAA